MFVRLSRRLVWTLTRLRHPAHAGLPPTLSSLIANGRKRLDEILLVWYGQDRLYTTQARLCWADKGGWGDMHLHITSLVSHIELNPFVMLLSVGEGGLVQFSTSFSSFSMTLSFLFSCYPDDVCSFFLLLPDCATLCTAGSFCLLLQRCRRSPQSAEKTRWPDRIQPSGRVQFVLGRKKRRGGTGDVIAGPNKINYFSI